jgi:hypothetical protein
VQSVLLEPVVVRALENSLRNTMTIEDEFVRKFRNASAGLFRERCDEIFRRNLVKIFRQEVGKEISAGRRGLYHHLYQLVLGIKGIVYSRT